MTATRLTPGATSLSSSSHFPLIENSAGVNPVMLPLGRARLVTKPLSTGSFICVNTMGMVWVSRRSGATVSEV